jgi:hypothetical protein
MPDSPLLVGDLGRAEHFVALLLDHSTKRGLALWHAWGVTYQGILRIKSGDTDSGLRLLDAGFDETGVAPSAFRFLKFPE